MDKNKQIKNLGTDASLYLDDAKKEKLNALLKNNEVIDWEKKGNLVRFYLGKNGDYASRQESARMFLRK